MSKDPVLAIVVKGYPRLSETFISQEIRALEKRGFRLLIVSLRHPTDTVIHDVHDEIQADVLYLPEYLRNEPWRVLKSSLNWLWHPAFWRVLWSFGQDWRREPTRNRTRRFGQALVLATELPRSVCWIHTHYMHTPSAMTRYTSQLRALPWSISAHAKDIWTTSDWQKRQHLDAASWIVTCTKHNQQHLQALAPSKDVTLIYHGLDTSILPSIEKSPQSSELRIVTVARAVEKKGLDCLLEALAMLPEEMPWRWNHIGSGPDLDQLKGQAERLKIQDHVSFRGAMTRQGVFECLADADIFCLPARVAADGDRDGLPNALMEAMHEGVALVASDLPGIAELIDDGETGLLVPPDDATALKAALLRLALDKALHARLVANGKAHIQEHFRMEGGIDLLHRKFVDSGVPCG